MKKKLFVSGSFFFLIIAAYFYFYTREHKIYEVNADNYTELKKVNEVDYFKAYTGAVYPYKGFDNLRMVQSGIRERISERNGNYATYDYSGGNETFEGYGVNLIDCSRLSVQMEYGKIIKILQLDSKSCPADILRERVDFLMTKGFALSESRIKGNNHSILIKDLDDDYFHIIRFYYDEYQEKITAIEFGLFSKAKYPDLRFI